MAEVYWIHLPEHTDMFSEGYIGYTSKTAKERFKEHLKDCASKSRKKNSRLYPAMRKYGVDRFIVETICICDQEYGLWLEWMLRPDGCIGLNILPGGMKRSSNAVTEETRRKLAVASRNRVVSDESRRRMSLAQKNRPPVSEETRAKNAEASRKRVRWENNFANKDVWLHAISIFDSWVNNPVGIKTLSKLHGLPPSNFAGLVQSFKAGWNPHADEKYLAWREAYSEEQRKEPNDKT